MAQRIFALNHRLLAMRIAFSLLTIAFSVWLFTRPGSHSSTQARAAAMEERGVLCEIVAVANSLAAHQNNFEQIETLFESLLVRHPQLVKLEYRDFDQTIIRRRQSSSSELPHQIEAENQWEQVRVPLLEQGHERGYVELSFAAPVAVEAHGMLDVVRRWGLFWAATFVAFTFYVGRLLRAPSTRRSQVDRVVALLDSFAEALVVLDEQQRVITANHRFQKLVSRSLDGLRGRELCGFRLKRQESERPAEDGSDLPWTRAADSEEVIAGCLVSFDPPSTDPPEDDVPSKTLLVNATPITNPTSRCQGILVSLDDITDLQRRNDDLRAMLTMLHDDRRRLDQQSSHMAQLATRDDLTGVLNRRALFEVVSSQFESSKRYESQLSCLLINLDNFQEINDRLGREVGDKVMSQTAKWLQSCLRESDVLGRLVNDEFCVLLPHQSADDATSTCERIRCGVERHSVAGIPLTVSIGLVDNSMGSKDWTFLLRQAYEAVAVAKRQGRNRVCIWNRIPHAIQEECLALTRHAQDLQSTSAESIPLHAVHAVFSTLTLRSPAIAGHCRRVADLCVVVGSDLLLVDEVYVLEVAALLHEVGKIGLPDELQHNVGPLNEQERALMEYHARRGRELVQATFQSDSLSALVASTQELGFGEPLTQWPQRSLPVQILALADEFDRMTYDRSGQRQMSQEDALTQFVQLAERGFSQRLIRHFRERLATQTATLISPAPTPTESPWYWAETAILTELRSLDERIKATQSERDCVAAPGLTTDQVATKGNGNPQCSAADPQT